MIVFDDEIYQKRAAHLERMDVLRLYHGIIISLPIQIDCTNAFIFLSHHARLS